MVFRVDILLLNWSALLGACANTSGIVGNLGQRHEHQNRDLLCTFCTPNRLLSSPCREGFHKCHASVISIPLIGPKYISILEFYVYIIVVFSLHSYKLHIKVVLKIYVTCVALAHSFWEVVLAPKGEGERNDTNVKTNVWTTSRNSAAMKRQSAYGIGNSLGQLLSILRRRFSQLLVCTFRVPQIISINQHWE